MSDKMSDKRLLPCPFCGGENMQVYDCGTPSEPCWVVECLHCKVSTSDYWDEDGAITAWNTRKPMERIVERLDSECKKHCDATRTYIDSDENDLGLRHLSKANAFCKAIEIIKEEGGV